MAQPLLYVSGYCQVAGLQHVLEGMLTGWRVKYLPYPADNVESLASFAEQIASADAWASADTYPHFNEVIRHTASRVRALRWPQVVFPAFHPDVVLAWGHGQQIPCCQGHPYHSAILLWAYLNELTLDQAIQRFRADIFNRLGYFDNWQGSVERLREQFHACEMDFELYFRGVKRSGVFMHSHDHSKVISIIHVARQIIKSLTGSDADHFESAGQFFDDSLMHDAVWPVYPDIASRYGVAGSYRWRIRNVFFKSLEDFAVETYSTYRAAGITKAYTYCERFVKSPYDEVLLNSD